MGPCLLNTFHRKRTHPDQDDVDDDDDDDHDKEDKDDRTDQIAMN